jgi:radical SAM protein with 4Fe4S-binding SPASM domain
MASENLLKQDFIADEPYKKLLTDITQVQCKDGKLYISPILDCYNGEILSLLSLEFPQPWETNARSVRLAERVYLAEDDRFDWPDPAAADRGERCFCYGLRDQIGVLCDGTVVPCCLDHNGDVPLGNLFLQDLKEIMSTDKARRIYDGFSQRKAAEELCRRCGYARRFT